MKDKLVKAGTYLEIIRLRNDDYDLECAWCIKDADDRYDSTYVWLRQYYHSYLLKEEPEEGD